MVVELKNPEQPPKETSTVPEQSFEKAPSSWQEPPTPEQTSPVPEQSFEKAPSSLQEPPIPKQISPVPEKPFEKAPSSWQPPKNTTPVSFEETPSSVKVPFKKPARVLEQASEEASSLGKVFPKKKPPTMPEQAFEETPSSEKVSPRKKSARIPEKSSEVTLPSSWKEPPKKSIEKKAPSAWERPLVKAISPKPSRDTCWMCGRYHQRDEDEGCRADRKVVEAPKSRPGWGSTIDSQNDWDWRNEWNGQANGWSDGETTKLEPKGHYSTKGGYASKEHQTAKDSQNRDKNGAGYVNRQSEGAIVEAATRSKKSKKERTQKESTPNGRLERVKVVSEDSAMAPRSDGAKSLMFKADGNHFGQYYEDKLDGVKKLSEDTLHMIFSYVADGLMPEDQMKMKNVHIGSNFRLDASFTSIRYRRLKSVLRSCRYWRHLSQHIVYKYVNLDQFCNFKGFVRTISEDAELGKMVRAVKINIQGGASYISHDNRPSRQELSEMPKSSDSAQLFTVMMESCPELQILSANMYGAIRGFNFVLTKFLKMREIQIMDDSSKGMVAHNLWKNLGNYPNLEKFRIFHSEENGATNFDTLKLPPKDFFNKTSTTFLLKALTMERAPELSDKILGIFASRLKQLTNLVIVDCKLVTSAGASA